MALQPTSLVLVAVVNDPRDLEIARLLGWYRIPAAHRTESGGGGLPGILSDRRLRRAALAHPDRCAGAWA